MLEEVTEAYRDGFITLPAVLDLKRIRAEPEAVKAALARRGDPAVVADIDRVLDLDHRHRAVLMEWEELRHRVKALSGEVRTHHQRGERDKAAALQAESRELGERADALQAGADALAAEIRQLLLGIPNMPADEAPEGAGPTDNVTMHTGGPDPESYEDHQRVPHWEVGAALGILDLDRAVKLSGSMFVMYRGWGARLLRALTQLALDRHGDAYEEVRPPTFVRTETMVSTGQLPKFADDAYHIEQDDLWAIPTAEVPLTSMARDEILDESELPQRFTAYTPCFRREAGSAGADTRGLLRSHEFDKVELFAYSTPDQAAAVHADILHRAEALVADLGFAYRVLDLCAGDLGFSNARTFDIEVFAPGVGRWLEVSSVSWYADFQARRANIRYRPSATTPGSGTQVVHTCNGSALAWSRIMAALLEVNRRPDGGLAVPSVLRPYVGGVEVIGPP